MSFTMTNSTIPALENSQSLFHKTWFRLFANLFTASTAGSTDAVSPLSGSSPYTFTPTQKGQVLVSGGTVSAIEFSRDGTTFYSTGETAGMFPVSSGDSLKVTYSAIPTMVFIPL